MAYKKIYYNDIWEITSKGTKKSGEWLQNFSTINTSLNTFVGNYQFKGQAADNMKNYLTQVHGILIPIIQSILQTYAARAASYYSGYINSVDSGDGADSSVRYTTIVYNEVNNSNGSIKKELDKIRNMADQVARDANSVKYNISNLVNISAYPKTSNLNTQITAAINKAKTVNDKAIAFEGTRANDFAQIDRLIAQATSIINNQLGKSRIPIIAYQNGAVAKMCDIEQILVDLEATAEIVETFENSDDYDEAMNLAYNREELIEKWEQESREWIQWVAVGVAVVGAVALIVVTAGGAAPGVCVAVGAFAGGTAKASKMFADNYVKTGSLTEGMDWKEFGTEVFAATVVGGISGYYGAVSQGSAIKGPLKTALQISKQNIIEEGADGLIKFGSAAVLGPPDGETIWSVASNEFEDVLVKGAEGFAGGLVSGKFNVDTGDKSYIRKLGEKTAENAAREFSGGFVKTGWDLGESYVKNHNTDEFQSILKDNSKDTVGKFIGSTAGAAVSEGFTGIKDIKNPFGKGAAETFKDTASDTLNRITKGVTERGMSYAYGDEKDAGKILGDIWDEDLDKGRNIAESAAKSAGKHTANEVYKDKKLYNDLKKIDHDHDGKVDVVQFGEGKNKYAVTKEDYDAAVANAGKGAYKDKTVQDILGIPKDTDLSTGKQRSVSIDMTEKYSSDRKTTDTVTVDGKYTFKKDYYESAVNAAGKGEYKDKTVQDILGVPKDTDVSENNITHKRVYNSDIGQGKDVELTNDDTSKATKIHISSMKYETRVAKEKEKQETQKQDK